MATLHLDFEDDLYQYYLRRFSAANIPLPHIGKRARKLDKLITLATAWHHYQNHLLIPVRPRSVLMSAEISAALTSNNGVHLRRIADTAAAGGDLNPYQTRKIANNHSDGMLADWGIHHLHLGPIAPGKRFSERGLKDLLFVRVEPDVIYFIHLRDHSSFEDLSILEILNREWPSSIARFRTNAVALPFVATPKQRKRIRNLGYTQPTQLSDGSIYMMLGPGQTLAKRSALALELAHREIDAAKSVARHCKERISAIHSYILAKTHEDVAGIRLKLDPEKASIEETRLGINIPLHVIGLRAPSAAVGPASTSVRADTSGK